MIDFKDEILTKKTMKEHRKNVKKARTAFNRGELDSVPHATNQKMKWNGKD